MSARYPWLDFQYSDPDPNFDRSQVHGVAAKLFSIKDPKFAVALDPAGGGKVCKQTQCTINTFPAPARLPSPRYAASEFLKFLFHVCWVVQPRRGPGGTAALSPSLGAEF